MGVPISYLKVHNPDQFEIVGLGQSDLGRSVGVGDNIDDEKWAYINSQLPRPSRGNLIYINEKGELVKPFTRVLIRSRLGENNEQRSS